MSDDLETRGEKLVEECKQAQKQIHEAALKALHETRPTAVILGAAITLKKLIDTRYEQVQKKVIEEEEFEAEMQLVFRILSPSLDRQPQPADDGKVH